MLPFMMRDQGTGRRPLPRALMFLCLAYLSLATLYGAVTPPFEVLDESYHYGLVKWVADGKGLPVMGPDAAEMVYRQEGAQPPLYYVLAAVSTFWMDTGNIRDLYRENPHAASGYPGATDNKNVVLHGPGEGFPWQGRILGLHMVRLLSTFLGLITVVATYLLARRATGGDGLLAVGAAALVAFNPMFLLIAGSVNNDNLINALSAVTLLVLSWILSGRRSPAIFSVLGLLVGAAMLSKLSGLSLLPLSLIVLAIVFQRERNWKLLAGSLAAVIGMSGIVAGWWYIRNWLLYGDPLGLNALLSVVNKPRNAGLAQLLGELEGFKLSFWGVFGRFNVLMGQLHYLFYDALAVLAAVGLLYLALRRRWRPLPAGQRVLAMHLIWIGAVALAIARYSTMTEASEGRLIFTAISSLGLLFSLGLFSFGPRRLRSHIVAAVSMAMLALAASAPFLYIVPAYPPAPLVTATEARSFTQPLNINFDAKMLLLGQTLDSTEARPGGEVVVTLYWQVLAPTDTDYSLFIHIFGREGLLIAQRDSFPGGGSYPTGSARPGDYLKDMYRIRIPPDVHGPAAATIEVGWYELSTLRRLEVRNAEGQALGSSLPVARFKLAGPGAASESTVGLTTLHNPMGDDIRLAGYQIASQEVPAGGGIRGRLHWKAVRRPPADYTVFVQLIGPNGLVSQYDAQPARGYYPTSFWDAGEDMLDDFELPVSRGTKPGRYELIAGMYDVQTGRRTSFGDRDHVSLGFISVR